MRLLLKLLASGLAWVVATLISAAAVELATGEARPALVPLPTLVLLVPVLLVIWRRRGPAI